MVSRAVMARYAIVVRPAPLLKRNSVDDWRDSAALDGQTDGTSLKIPPSRELRRAILLVWAGELRILRCLTRHS